MTARCLNNNIGPSPVLSGNSSAAEGSSYTLHLADNDPGSDGIDHWVIDWGDTNINNQADIQTVYGNPSTLAHLYRHAGSYAIAATAYDSGGLSNATPAGKSITVTDADPTISVDAPGTFNTRDDYTVYLSGRDPGHEGIDHWQIDWGDGTSSTAAGSAEYTSHSYDASAGATAAVLVTAVGGSGATATFTQNAAQQEAEPLYYWVELAASDGHGRGAFYIKPDLLDPTWQILPPQKLSDPSADDVKRFFVGQDYGLAFPASPWTIEKISGFPKGVVAFDVKFPQPDPENPWDTWRVEFHPLQVSARVDSYNREDGTAVINIHREGGEYLPASDVPWHIVWGGNFDPSSGIAHFDPGQTDVQITVNIINNDQPDWPEPIWPITGGGGYSGGPGSGDWITGNAVALSMPDGIIEANYNDSDQDGTPDYQQGKESVADPELVPLDLKFSNMPVDSGYLMLDVSGPVTIWSDQYKSEEIIGPHAGSYETWNNGWETPPHEVWVEATHGSSSLEDIHITFSSSDIDGMPTGLPATVKRTAVGAKLLWKDPATQQTQEAGAEVPAVVVGDSIDPVVDVQAPQELGGSVLWQRPAGTIFDTYTKFDNEASQHSASLTPFNDECLLGPRTIHFVWAAPPAGHAPVTISVEVTFNNGPTIDPETQVRVLLPQVTKQGATIGSAVVLPGNQIYGGDNADTYLAFASDANSAHGLVAGATVSDPIQRPSVGAWAFLQLVKRNEVETLSAPPPLPAIRNRLALYYDYGLDAAFPGEREGVKTSLFQDPAFNWLAADGSRAWKSGTAGKTFDDPGDYAERRDVLTIEDQFKTYIMYNPGTSGAEWVPVQMIEWQWHGTVRKVGNGYSPDPGNSKNDPDPTFVATAVHPEWSFNALLQPKGDNHWEAAP